MLVVIILVLIIMGALWAAVLLIDRHYNLKKRGFEVAPGLLLWRTKRGLGLLDRIANFSKKLWKVFGIIGAAVGSILMVLVFLNLTDKAIGIISTIISPPPAGGAGVPGVVPIIPGWTIPLKVIVPFLIAIATVLLVHEPAHGIMARRAGIPVKSTGLLLLAVIPGAFVEPDEKKLKKSSVSKRLQVYGAGSFANILFGFLCLGILLMLVAPLTGLYVSDVVENTPADSENLQPGMRLMGIGYRENTLVENYKIIKEYSDFGNFMDGTRPGDNIILVTDSENFEITLENRPDDNVGYLGVYTVQSTSRPHFFSATFTSILTFWKSPGAVVWGLNQYSYDYRAPVFVIDLLVWMFILNLGIGLFNLLPLKPLDGGHITECLAEKVSSPSTARWVAIIFSVISLVVLVVNLLDWVV